jgi:hypothetical protein
MWQLLVKNDAKGIKRDGRTYHHGLTRYVWEPKLWLVVILCRFYVNQFGPFVLENQVLQESLRMILMILKSRTCTGLQHWSRLTLLYTGNSVIQVFLLYFRGAHIP